MVYWRARLFMADKVIHPAIITGAYKTGFVLKFHQALAIGTEMNVEFAVKFRDEMHRIRVKAKVAYCQLGGGNSASEVEMDISTIKISREDNHLMGNILQTLANSAEMNLKT